MSREYSKVRPRFWTGDTGKIIRKLGRDCQVIGFYLMTCPSANMLGLYYLAMPTLCHETHSPLKGALKALRSLQEAKFAYYDLSSEIVYVPNMAREQIGERLKRKDNRHVAVLRELESLRKTPFFNDFVIRYRDVYELQDVVVDPDLASPLEGPSKALRSQEQDQEQEQNQEQEHTQEAMLHFHESLPRANWDEWIAHRRRKKWPVDPTTLGKQLKLLARLTAEEQVDSIEKSINAGWQGLFEPKRQNGSGHKTKFARTMEALDRAS